MPDQVEPSMDLMDFYHVNDRRTYRRFAVTLPARLYHRDGRFSLCWTADLSPAGAAIQLNGAGAEAVSAFGCDETGKIAVSRFEFTKPFVRLVFETSSQTHAVIKHALRSLGDRQLIKPLSLRRAHRLSTRNVTVTRADGSHLVCDILDMSPQGMLLGSGVRPALGERVGLGKLAGVVVRHHEHGFAIRMQEHAPSSNVVRFPLTYRPLAAQSSPSVNDLA
jgi:hypothetical protein